MTDITTPEETKTREENRALKALLKEKEDRIAALQKEKNTQSLKVQSILTNIKCPLVSPSVFNKAQTSEFQNGDFHMTPKTSKFLAGIEPIIMKCAKCQKIEKIIYPTIRGRKCVNCRLHDESYFSLHKIEFVNMPVVKGDQLEYIQTVMGKLLGKKEQILTHELIYNENEEFNDHFFQGAHFASNNLYRCYQILLKRAMEKNDIGPLLPVWIEDMEGYGVYATMDIQKNSLLCEYMGEVLVNGQLEVEDARLQRDDVVKLIEGRKEEYDMLIIPNRACNIARFINSIDDRKRDHLDAQNVTSARIVIDGKLHYIYYARKAITAGEQLYVNYNEGAPKGGRTYPISRGFSIAHRSIPLKMLTSCQLIHPKSPRQPFTLITSKNLIHLPTTQK